MAIKKILFVIDRENSSLDLVARKFKEHLRNYRIEIISSERYEGNIVQLLLDAKDYDIIHFFDREYFANIDVDWNLKYLKNIGYTKEEFYKEYYKNKITFAVCDHLDLNKEEIWKAKKAFLFSDYYYVISERLYNIYKKFKIKPKQIIREATDTKVFFPENENKYKEDIIKSRELVIGWIGNTKYDKNDFNFTGLNDIIVPTFQELQKEGLNVKLEICDKNIFPRPQRMVPQFLNSIDIAVFMSKSEGSPITLLQAMACGIPIITSDVGIAKEVFGKRQKKYIMKVRTSTKLKSLIKEMIRNPNEMYAISKENRYKVLKYNWNKSAKQLDKFFKAKMKDIDKASNKC